MHAALALLQVAAHSGLVFLLFSSLNKYLCFFQITQWLKGSLTLNPQPDYHIGLSRVNGTFVWESGHQLSADVVAHWEGGQPNNVGGIENCAVVSSQSGQEKLWDRDCANKQSFLCQRRMESGNVINRLR